MQLRNRIVRVLQNRVKKCKRFKKRSHEECRFMRPEIVVDRLPVHVSIQKIVNPSLAHAVSKKFERDGISNYRRATEESKRKASFSWPESNKPQSKHLLKTAEVKNSEEEGYTKLRRSARIHCSRNLGVQKSRQGFEFKSGSAILVPSKLLKKVSSDDNHLWNSRAPDMNISYFSKVQTRAVTRRRLQEMEICLVCGHTDMLICCTKCTSKYHLTCLGLCEESATRVCLRRANDWLCPACLLCFACGESVDVADNVQCYYCDGAFHDHCRPKGSTWTDPTNPLSDWFCDSCSRYFTLEYISKPENCEQKFDLKKSLQFFRDKEERNENSARNIEVLKEVSVDRDYQLYKDAEQEFFARMAVISLPEERATCPSTSQWVHYGGHQFLTSCQSAYPKSLAMAKILCLCKFCLMAFNSDARSEVHEESCERRHPPGREIYRENGYSFREVDGSLEPEYCRRLCLMAKLILSSKTLYVEVDEFLFYILTQNSRESDIMCGYFSKEKRPKNNNNLSCLVTLPFAQRNGFGKFLIDLSYKLSLREQKMGGPEHPLSDLGLMTYRSYWKSVIFTYLRKKKHSPSISMKELSDESGIQLCDIVSTLAANNMVKMKNGACLIDKRKAINAPLLMIRRRVVKDEHLIWKPQVYVHSSIHVSHNS